MQIIKLWLPLFSCFFFPKRCLLVSFCILSVPKYFRFIPNKRIRSKLISNRFNFLSTIFLLKIFTIFNFQFRVRGPQIENWKNILHVLIYSVFSFLFSVHGPEIESWILKPKGTKDSPASELFEFNYFEETTSEAVLIFQLFYVCYLFKCSSVQSIEIFYLIFWWKFNIPTSHDANTWKTENDKSRNNNKT